MIGSCMLAAAEELDSRQKAWIKNIVQKLPKNKQLQQLVREVIYKQAGEELAEVMDYGHDQLIDWVKNNDTVTYWSAIQVAAKNIRNNCIRQILLEGREMDELDKHGLTDLMKVVLTGNSVATQMLINARADVNQLGKRRETPLMRTVIHAGELEVMRTLLANKADVNLRAQDGSTALIQAIGPGFCSPEVVKELLGAKADVNAKGEYYTPLEKFLALNIQEKEVEEALRAAGGKTSAELKAAHAKAVVAQVLSPAPAAVPVLVAELQPQPLAPLPVAELQPQPLALPSAEPVPVLKQQPLAQSVTVGFLANPPPSFWSSQNYRAAGLATLLAVVAVAYAWWNYYPSNTVEE